MSKLASSCASFTVAILSLCFLTACNFEQRAWEKAQRNATIEAYEGYLEDHPAGPHAAEAESGIDRLVWERAREANTIDAYEEYLSLRAEGSFADEARAAIEELTPAELVARWVHTQEEKADWLVTLEDPEQRELSRYREPAWRRTEYEYSKYNSSIVSKARHQTYVTIEDGTRVQARDVTDFDAYGKPKTKSLYSPDGRAVGRYGVVVSRGGGRVDLSRTLQTSLPVARYAYDGVELQPVEVVPKDASGVLIDDLAGVNLIFAADFSAIAAVLPRAEADSGFALGDQPIGEIGFTMVEIDGTCRILPYLDTATTKDGSTSTWSRFLYDKVPNQARDQFERLVAG